MKGWAILAGAILAVGVAGVVVSVALHRRALASNDNVPDLLEDCTSRIREIEHQLSLLKPELESA